MILNTMNITFFPQILLRIFIKVFSMLNKLQTWSCHGQEDQQKFEEEKQIRNSDCMIEPYFYESNVRSENSFGHVYIYKDKVQIFFCN